MAYLLVVDDDADSRDVLCRFLVRAGHQVNGAPNGREALASILARTPDLIVLDLLMPEMDGTDLLEITRSYLRLQHVPVVVLTAAPDSPQAFRAKRQKVRAILPKGKASFADIHRVISEELRPVA
jgi:CheY-like chemotaxis protein